MHFYCQKTACDQQPGRGVNRPPGAEDIKPPVNFHPAVSAMFQCRQSDENLPSRSSGSATKFVLRIMLTDAYFPFSYFAIRFSEVIYLT